VYGYGSADQQGLLQQETLLDQINTRLVQLELQDRRCIADARRHRAAGAKSLFRSKMLEHRRVQGQMAQNQRFKENAMAQFDALSNHELNRTFVRTMKSMVGASKSRVSAVREDAETVMDDFHDSISQVKDLSEFLGQPMSVDDVDDAELELEFLEEIKDIHSSNEQPFADRSTVSSPVVVQGAAVSLPVGVANRIEDMLVIRPMLPSF
jgi:hypothetical protein